MSTNESDETVLKAPETRDRKVYHTDPGCPNLSRKEPLEYSRKNLERHGFRECVTCGGEQSRAENPDWGPQRALRRAAVEGSDS